MFLLIFIILSIFTAISLYMINDEFIDILDDKNIYESENKNEIN